MKRFPFVMAAALIAGAPLPALAAPLPMWVMSWCTEMAVDALAALPEAASTIVAAAYGACHTEEYAVGEEITARLTPHDRQTGVNPRVIVRLYKRDHLDPILLARVLANRAARATPKAAARPRYLEQ